MTTNKRMRVGGTSDTFYQDWCFKVTSDVANGNFEYTLDCPRPLRTPPPGRYYAIQVHSLTGLTNKFADRGSTQEQYMSLSTTPRIGKDPFITGPGDPDNIWYRLETFMFELADDNYLHIKDSKSDKTPFTDDLGRGLLIIGDHLYLQMTSTNTTVGHFPTLSCSIQYTFTTVSAADMIGELASQIG